MTVSAMASGTPKLLCSVASHRRLNPSSRVKGSVKFLIDANNRRSCTTSFPIRAVDNQTQTEEEKPSLDFIPQEDVSYVWKLFFGSAVGAAIIKYGSILFPEITRPNIVLALIMITTPVIIAVLLLIKGGSSSSSVKQ